MEEFNFNSSMQMGMDNSFTWEMIGLGLEEPLPPQETIDELYVGPRLRPSTCRVAHTPLISRRHQIFFDKVHPSLPMIHKYRYLAAMNLYVVTSCRRSLY